jgi:hypothetical protein
MTIVTHVFFYLNGSTDFETREYNDVYGPARVVTELFAELYPGVLVRVNRCVQVRDGDGSRDHPIVLS